MASREPGWRAAPWIALAAILAGAVVAYLPALHGEFHFDDWGSIQGNLALRSPDALRLPSLASMLRPDRPLTQLTFALDHRAAGLDPFRYHVVSLALHLCAAGLAFLFTRGLLRRAGHPRSGWLAVVAAGAFSLHPIQSEAVAYAAQRAEVLASLFYLLCLILLDQAATFGPRTLRGGFAWAGGIAAWIAAMGSKTVAITAPATFVLEQGLVGRDEGAPRERRRRWLRALSLSAPLFLLAGWSAFLNLRSFAATPSSGIGAGAQELTSGTYLLTQLRVHWLYLRLLAWPDMLAFDRGFSPSRSLDGRAAIAGMASLALVALAAWLWLRAERVEGPAPALRIVAFGILFWFLVLAPTSSVLPVRDLAVEHRVYLASLGPILAVVVTADAWLHRLLGRHRAAQAGAAIALTLLLALGVALSARARVWATEGSLWGDAARKFPDSPRILTNLGLALMNTGDIDGAERAFRGGWAVASSPLDIVQSSRNLGGFLAMAGRFPESLQALDRGLKLAPDHPELRMNRAFALAGMGRRQEALVDARRALAVAPASPALLNVYGEILSRQGDWDGALGAFQSASRLDPDSPIYFTNRALPLGQLGRRGEACGVIREAVERFGAANLPSGALRWKEEAGCVPEGGAGESAR
jgi:Flp pilus assembly protein TadD